MESTLKDIKNKTYGIVTDPTYMSYGLIGFTTLILGYYVFYDKNSSPGSSEAEAGSSEEAPSSAPSAGIGGMFGSSADKDATSEGASSGSENKDEASTSEPSAGLFGSENNDAASGEPAAASEEPKEETSVGGKRKKTRRQRKQNKSAKSKKQSNHAKKKN